MTASFAANLFGDCSFKSVLGEFRTYRDKMLCFVYPVLVIEEGTEKKISKNSHTTYLPAIYCAACESSLAECIFSPCGVMTFPRIPIALGCRISRSVRMRAMNFGADFGVLLINFTILGMWQMSLPILMKIMAVMLVWRRCKLERWCKNLWLRRPIWLLWAIKFPCLSSNQ